MRYRTVLWDLDHTLLDSDASERLALAETLRSANVDDMLAVVEAYKGINGALWARVESGELSPNVVKTRRFEELVQACGFDADPHAMASDFVACIGRFGELYPGALAALSAAAETSDQMALVTNGIGSVQRARLSRLGIFPLFDALVISGEVGHSKPGAAIFDRTFELLGVAPDAAVMVGDSITSDMRGGVDYGLDTIWFNRHGAPAPDDLTPTHTVGDLDQLARLFAARSTN